MNNKSRTKNFAKNAILGIVMQVLLLILTFVSRTVFINILSEDYLGINGLYSNILSVLSLADLGLTTVMIYALYKPIAENDKEKISKLINYFKKVYRIIALSVFVLGLICVPFLQYIVVGSGLDLFDLRLYFILYLVNSVSTYLVVYKTTLINADQQVYIIKIADFLASFLIHVAQIVILYLTHNYLAYLVSNIVITLLKNVILSVIADRIYPFLKKHKTESLSRDEKKPIIDNVKSIFIYRVSAMIMNSTDNILISVILGTAIVGYYSNYALIIGAITAFIKVFIQAVLASLGNFNAVESPEKRLKMYRCLLFSFFFIATLCSAVLVAVFNDFIVFWIGGVSENYVLSNIDVWAIIFNFYISCVLNPIWMFRETTGLFKKTKYAMTCAAVLNIALSIVLGNLIGLGGILIATALSTLLTNFWYESRVLFRDVFKCKMGGYWLFLLKLFLQSAICVGALGYIDTLMPRTFGFMIIEGIIAVAITMVIFVVCNFKTTEFRYIKTKAFALLKLEKKYKK